MARTGRNKSCYSNCKMKSFPAFNLPYNVMKRWYSFIYWFLQWLDLMNSMLREAIWTRDAYVPTINEYMENAYVSFALGPIVLPALYFLGPKLSEEIVQSSEYHNLYKLMSTQGRLLNDIQSFKVNVFHFVTLSASNDVNNEAC